MFIKATPEQIWDAITKPEFTQRYFHGARIDASTPEHRTARGPDGRGVGRRRRSIEFDPPRRLVHGWRALYDPEIAAEEREPRDVGDRAAGRRRLRCSRSSTTGSRARRRRRRASPARLDAHPQRPEDAPRDRRAALMTTRDCDRADAGLPALHQGDARSRSGRRSRSRSSPRSTSTASGSTRRRSAARHARRTTGRTPTARIRCSSATRLAGSCTAGTRSGTRSSRPRSRAA